MADIITLAKCKALLLLPMGMATNPPVSSKLHCFSVVSYLANLTAVPYAAFYFSESIGWTMKNVVVSAEGQAAHKALRERFAHSGLQPQLLHGTHFHFCVGHSGENGYPVS